MMASADRSRVLAAALLGAVFTAAQIVELGFTCAQSMGLHRFIHTLEVFGTDPPVVAYSPEQVDSRAEERTTAGV